MAISNAYNKGEINAFLDLKPDETELTAAVATINNSIDLKLDKTVFDTATGAINSTLSQKANTIDVNTSLATSIVLRRLII